VKWFSNEILRVYAKESKRISFSHRIISLRELESESDGALPNKPYIGFLRNADVLVAVWLMISWCMHAEQILSVMVLLAMSMWGTN